MLREVVGAGHHVLFSTNLDSVEQKLYPIPLAPSSEQSQLMLQDADSEGLSDLDLNDLKQGVKK
jgi:hypothetical protein